MAMGRGVLAATLVGVVQGLVAVLLVVTLGTGNVGTAGFGWFAYTPLQQGAGFVVPGPPRVTRESLLVPLVLGALGGLAAWLLGRRGEPASWSGDRRVLLAGVAGLVLAVVTVALSPAEPMPHRYADYLPPAGRPDVAPAVVLVLGSGLGALVLVALAGLAYRRRWGGVGTVVALALGVVGISVQVVGDGLAPITLAGEVVALVLVAAALVLARRGRAQPA